ncbi:MAG: cellulase family glycosylhydrolase [Chloroflexi bacterium]|nr:cellulase family glycosylhydrolase [Chloroflexota bacterium]
MAAAFSRRALWRSSLTLVLALIGAACGPMPQVPAPSDPFPEPAAATSQPPEPAAHPPADPALARLNYFHTDGTTIRDVHGNQVHLTGVNWFGMETDTLSPHGLWARNLEDMLDQVREMGFNVIRLPFSNELFNPDLTPQGIDFALNPDLRGLSGLEILDRVIVGAGQRGIKVMLDQHRATTDGQSKLWYTRELSEDLWIAHWRALAQRYRGNDTVIGIDLHNEPAGDATWGSGDRATDWRLAAERAGNAILEVNPYLLIFVEGIEKNEDDYGNIMDWYWMGGSLQYARLFPVRLTVPGRLVYSPHDYGPGVYPQGWFQHPDFPENLPEVWDHHWGYLQQEGIAPLFLGEFGGRSVGDDAEGQWQRRLVRFLKERGIGYAYWSLNGNSGDTGGLLGDDWRTVDQAKLKVLADYQGEPLPSYNPTHIEKAALPAPAPQVAPLKVLHQDKNREQWTPVLTPELHIANKTTQPVDVGGVELRYWFTADGGSDRSGAPDQVVRVERLFTMVDGQPRDLDKRLAQVELVRDPDNASAIDPQFLVRVVFRRGVTVPPRTSVGVLLQVRKRDGSAYYQGNDYSYREYHWPTEWERVGLYQGSKLVWGMDPQEHRALVQARQEQREQARQRRAEDTAANLKGSQKDPKGS